MPSITINARYTGRQPLVSFLETNLDPDEVQVFRSEMAFKAVGPVEFLLSATAVYLLNRFVLDPLIGPLAEKWKNVVRRWLTPTQNFHLDIKIGEEDMGIEAYCGADHDTVVDIWRIVRVVLDAAATDSLVSSNSRIRIMTHQSGDPEVFCYKDDVPVRKIDIQTGIIADIPEDERSLADPSPPTSEDWIQIQMKRAARYQEYVDHLQKEKDV